MMTTEEEKEFELLLAEADYCNRQIGNYFDLQIKIVGLVVSAVGVSLGLLFAAGKDGAIHLLPEASAKILVALSGVMTFSVIQGAITYGTALGYMHYKSTVVAPRIKNLLALSEFPLGTVRSILQGPAGRSVVVASMLATAGILAVNFFTLTYAWSLAAAHPGIQKVVGVAGIGLAASAFCAVLVVQAARRVGEAARWFGARPPSEAPRAGA